MSTYIPTRNDLANLIKLRDDYSDGQAKGFIHGFQKDLIQNSTGARYKNKKFNSPWQITIELKKINNKYCLIATDKGTTGLIGGAYKEDVRSTKLRNEWAGGKIPPQEALTRFLNFDFSGGGEGAGSKGQGKGLYHMLSTKECNYSFVFESVQVGTNGEKGAYLCGRKWIDDIEVRVDFQAPDKPDQIESLKKDYIQDFKKWTNNELEPLDEVGTRIIIIGVDVNKTYSSNHDLNFLQIFKNSFDKNIDDFDCTKSFYNMIQETWWEIILKKGDNATFLLKFENKTRYVKNDGNMSKIYNATEDNNLHIVKTHKNIDLGYEDLKIKKLTLIYFKNEIDGLKQGIYINRKWMRVGNSLPDHKRSPAFNKKFYGYVELEEKVEEKISECENNTHYGFRANDPFMRRYFNPALYTLYSEFKYQCGLDARGRTDQSQALRDSYLNIVDKLKFAAVSSLSPTNKIPDFQLKIKKMLKSSKDWSVEYTDTIGPISLRILNNEPYDLKSAKFSAVFEQEGVKDILINEKVNFDILKNNYFDYDVPKFSISNKLKYGKVAKLKLSLFDSNGLVKAKNTRLLWLGLDEPNVEKKRIQVTRFSADLPNSGTNRVNINQIIDGFNYSLISNLNVEIECILMAEVTYNENGRKNLFDHYEKSIKLQPNSELNDTLPSLNVDSRFDYIAKRDAIEKNREIKIQLQVISDKDYEDLKIQKGELLSNKKEFNFFIEYDPVGKGPFSDFRHINDSSKPKSSWERKETNKFEFTINYGHRCWQELSNYGIYEDDLKQEYNQIEMVKQTIFLCLETGLTDNSIFEALNNEGATSYKDYFSSSDINPQDTIKHVDELVEKILR